MRILLMDCPFTMAGSESFGFASAVSVFDYDVVVWDPKGTYEAYTASYLTLFRGDPSLSDHASAKMVADIARRTREFKEFLRLGKVLVTFARPASIIWAQTGEEETSGTGRNRLQTNLVKSVDVLDALPIRYKPVPGSGIEVEPASPVVNDLWRLTRSMWSYRCLLEEYPGRPLFKVAGLDLVIGCMTETSDGGTFVVLPELWIQEEEETEDDSGVRDDESAELEVVAALRGFIEALGESDLEALPEWCATLAFPAQRERGAAMTQFEERIAELSTELDTLKLADAEDDKWKQLLVAQGPALERQAVEGFKLMGFEVLEVERGRSDLRLRLGDQRVVVEIKGLARSAAEKNAAQLEKWVSSELTDGVTAKGILLVNGWRTTPIDSRERVFPDQMLAYSIARGHCLMTSAQLLVISRRIIDGDLSPDEPAAAILATSGCLAGYEDMSEVLAEQTLRE